MNSGSTSLQIFWAFQHRVWNLQPVGGFTGLGTSPVRMIRLRVSSIAGSGIGTAESSAWLYGWSGRS